MAYQGFLFHPHHYAKPNVANDADLHECEQATHGQMLPLLLLFVFRKNNLHMHHIQELVRNNYLHQEVYDIWIDHVLQ